MKMKANLIQLYENNSRGNWSRKNVTFSFSAHICLNFGLSLIFSH